MTMKKEAFLAEYSAYGNEMISELLDTFLKDCPDKMAALQNAVDKRDLDAIAGLSHNLKGSVSVFFDDKAIELASQLEANGNAGDISEINLLLEKFIQTIRQLQHDLEEMKSSID